MKVMKFGGTSLGDARRIAIAADLVCREAASRQVGVVVSAVAGMTDQLLAAADTAPGAEDTEIERAAEAFLERHAGIHEALGRAAGSEVPAAELEALAQTLRKRLAGIRLLGECPPSTRDQIAGLGERASAALVAGALRSRGATVFLVEPGEVIVTDDAFGDARVAYAKSFPKFPPLLERPERVLLMPGFIGRSESGRATTLGRNGSDHSATIMARGLGAEVVEIWTDVDGILSADPRTVASAFVLPELSYREAMEMAYFGAKVIHPLTLTPVMDAGIPVHILNTLDPSAPGTWIRARTRESRLVRAVTSRGDMALIDVQGAGMAGTPGIAARVFQSIASRGINVVFISQASSEQSICLAVAEADADRAVSGLSTDLAHEIYTRKIRTVEHRKGLAVLSVIGEGMRGKKGVAATLFAGLADAGVNVVAIAQGASEASISAIVDGAAARRAVTAVHDFFFNRTQTIHCFVVGAGLVASELLEQVRRQRARLLERRVDLRVCAISDSRSTLVDLDGIDLDRRDWRRELSSGNLAYREPEALLGLIRERELVNSVLVDATSDDAIAASYVAFLEAGVHVVTPNKKANTSDIDYYRRLRRAASAGRARFLYETTVGAGLPVIDTLQNLLHCGDRLVAFEGILSGSLSFICGRLEDGASFTDAVLDAGKRGFTESDPREDLRGNDVARKVLILARESGLDLEIGDVRVAGMLPPGFDESGSVAQFLERIRELDAFFAERTRAARSVGAVPRYVAAIRDGRCEVGLLNVPASSPLAAVRDGENVASFLTERYQPVPLVVRGYGAGPVVTATGVFSDILRIAWLHQP